MESENDELMLPKRPKIVPPKLSSPKDITSNFIAACIWKSQPSNNFYQMTMAET